MRKSMFALAIGVASLLPVSQVEAGPSLDAVKARGQLVCGVGGQALGFASVLTYKPVALEKVEDLRAAFFAGRCEVYSGDALALYGTRAAYAPIPQEYMVLPEMISKEPLSLVVRENDALFGSIVRWTFNAMLQAEESGITSKNVDEMTNSENPDIKRLLGVTPGLGKLLGVDEKWIYNIVKQVGNYGESFERNLGAGSQLKIPRGQNMLWNQGGLHYSPPFH